MMTGLILSLIIVVLSVFLFETFAKKETFIESTCDSVIATNFPGLQFSESKLMSRLSSLPTLYSPPPNSEKPKVSLTHEMRPNSESIQGDFAAFIKGPGSTKWPSNFQKVVSYFDFVIYNFYTMTFGFGKREKVDVIMRQTSFLPLSPAPFTGTDDSAGPDAAVTGWPVIFLQHEFMDSDWIEKNEGFWKITVGHELFHTYQISAYDYTWSDGYAESAAQFFGFLSLSVSKGSKGLEQISHGYLEWNAPSHFRNSANPIDSIFAFVTYENQESLKKYGHGMYDCSFWYYFYRQYPDAFLSFFDPNFKHKGPVIVAQSFANPGPFVPSKDAGLTCPKQNLVRNWPLKPMCKSNIVGDIDSILYSIPEFLAGYVGTALANTYYLEDFVAYYGTGSRTNSGKVRWLGFGYVICPPGKKDFTWNVTPNEESWRVVVVEFPTDSKKGVYKVYNGADKKASLSYSNSKINARIAFVAAADLNSDVQPEWQIS
jgi:hypothetical protein